MGKKSDDDHVGKSEGQADRREFLRLASLGTVVGGAAILSGASSEAEAATGEGKGYRDTAHIRAYYETARF